MSFILIFSLFACQTSNNIGYVDKTSYKGSRLALKEGKYKLSKARYPAKSSEFFIPTLEYAWLSFLNGKVNTKKLTKMSQTLEDAKILRVEDETRRFFFKELDEYYVPGEHEIIMFHLLTGLAFAQKNMPAQVRVEAKRAAYYLPGPFINKSDFDSPSIRMLLAALWLSCGEWQQARANLLKASKLSKAYAWAGRLARRKIAPKNFVLILKGVGPEVVWQPEREDSGRWGLTFVTEEKGAPLKVVSSKKSLTAYAGATDTWYVRHFERDTIPRTALDEVKHTTNVVIGSAGAVAITAVALVGAAVIVAGALVVSVGLVALAGESDSPELVGLALKFSGSMMMASFALADESTVAGSAKAVEIYDDHADESENYRFVRFLPSYIYASASDGELINPRLHKRKPMLDLAASGTRVLVFYEP